jgi:type IX secretion system PorP/SprF family membrane protein
VSKFSCVLFVIALTTRSACAQYFQFSQYNFTDQRVNPGMVGTTRYASVSLISRSQKTGGDFNINSNFFSATYPLLNRSTGKPWSGIGVTLMDDRSGGIFKTQEAAISYAMHIRLDRFKTLSLGFKGLFQTKSISLDGFNTSLQYIPDRGFSNSISNGENFAELRVNYNTFSAGIHWQQVDRKENRIAYWGISLFDMNKPKDSFLGLSSQLSSTFVVDGGFIAYQRNELSIFPEFLVSANNSNATINGGLRFQYEVRPMPNQVSAKIDLLTKYVPGRSGIVGLQLHKEIFSFGISYDFPLLTSNAGNLGALEVGIELRRLVSTRAEKYRAKRTKEIEARKKAAKELAAKRFMTKKPLQTQAIDSAQNKKNEDLLKVTDQTSLETKPVEIEKIDSTQTRYDASVGKMKQEPYLVEKITLRFQFQYNSVDLDDETESFLNDLSKTLETDTSLKLKIVGHTDNMGSERYNQHLSSKRAETVKKFLSKRGIDPSRITTEGMGMSQPLKDNDTEENRAINRRVEMLLLREN